MPFSKPFPRLHFLPDDQLLERTTPLLGLSGPPLSLFFSPKSLFTHDDSNRRRHRPFAVEIHGPLVHGRSRFRVQQHHSRNANEGLGGHFSVPWHLYRCLRHNLHTAGEEQHRDFHVQDRQLLASHVHCTGRSRRSIPPAIVSFP